MNRPVIRDAMRMSRPITIHLPWGMTLLVLVGGALLALWYWLADANTKPTVVFVASVAAACALFLGVFNDMAVRRAQNDRSRAAESFSLIRVWNDPGFSLTKQRCFGVAKRIEHKSGEEQMTIIRADAESEQAVVETLNFCEMIALASRQEFLDETTLRLYFRAIVTRLWTAFKPYIERRRAEVTNPRLFLEMEQLYSRWSQA